MLQTEVISDKNFGNILAIVLKNADARFTASQSLENVQMNIHIHLDQFQGRFMLVHRLQDTVTYDFSPPWEKI
jgi:hypothetical protein